MKYPETLIQEYLDGSSTVVLSEKYHIHHSTIRDYLVRNGVKLRSNKENSRKYQVNHDAFEVIDNEQVAYWLGFLAADGYVSQANGGKKVGLSLGIKDCDHLVKYKKFINSEYPIGVYKASGYSTNDYCRMIVTSDKMYDDLVKCGICEHKSNILTFPEWIPWDLKRHYLRGYVDGDGCITTNGNAYSLKVCGTDMFLEGVIAFLTEAGTYKHGRIEQRKADCYVKQLTLNGETAYRSLSLLYDNATVFLDRKNKRAHNALKYFSRLYQ